MYDMFHGIHIESDITFYYGTTYRRMAFSMLVYLVHLDSHGSIAQDWVFSMCMMMMMAWGGGGRERGIFSTSTWPYLVVFYLYLTFSTSTELVSTSTNLVSTSASLVSTSANLVYTSPGPLLGRFLPFGIPGVTLHN